jgi:hypothetical protein
MAATRAYLTKWFDRWARREGIADQSLCRAVRELEQGLVDASLGAHLFKKRIPAPGRGKRGSFRTLVALQTQRAAFFVYGFAKNERDNISDHELGALKRLAKSLFEFDDAKIRKAIAVRELRRIRCDDE